jgi:hypothetical protein
MFTSSVRYPLLFIHNQFSSYINKTTQKFKKEDHQFLTLPTFPPSPPTPPNIVFVILSISLLLNYYLYSKNLRCHNLSN